MRCSDAADQPEWEATDVFETGLPGNVTRRGTTVRFVCEERTPPWKTMGPLEDSHHRLITANRPPSRASILLRKIDALWAQ